MTIHTATRTVAALTLAATCLLAVPGAAHAASTDTGGHLLYRDLVLPVWDPYTKATLQTSTVHDV
jgi:hypothetical protein